VNKPVNQPSKQIIRYILAFLGLVSLFLGIVGIIVPLLPTTPFLLLSAALFMKSSRRLYYWLINHKYLGKYLTNYIHHKVISPKSKILSLFLLWSTITVSATFFTNQLIFKILLLTIAFAVTIHILSFKSEIEK